MAGKADIRAGRAFVELFVKGAKFEAGLRKMSSDLKSFGESAKQVGQKLAAMGVTAGIAIGAAVKRFADFDDQMRAFAGAAEASDAELATLTETAKRLGATTSFTAVQVASLMTELGRAGFTADEVDKMTEAVLNLARATGTDATLSSGIMSATLRQFGLDASQATRVADAFTVAANKSFNSVEQLGEALTYAGPDAKRFNMSLEDTLAILGGLGNIGIQASNAGTVLRRLLVLTGAEAEKLKDIFGVTFLDAAGNARPLVDVLGEVNEATKDLGTGERAAKLNEAFGLLGITAASAIGGMVGDIKSLQSSLENASGTAQKTAARMDAGLGGSLRRILSSIEGVAISLGTSLEPVLKKIAAMIVEVVGKIKSWIDNNRELAVMLTGLVGGVGLLGISLTGLTAACAVAAIAVKGLAATIAGAIAFFSGPAGLIAAVAALSIAIDIALVAAFVHATGAVPQLVSALAPLLGAIKAISAAILSGDFQKAWDVAATSVKYFGSVAMDVFGQIPEFAGHAVGKIARAFVDGFKATYKWIATQLQTVLTSMLKAASGFAPQLLTAMFTGNFTAAAANIALAMKEAIKGAVDSASSVAKEFGGAAGAAFEGGEAPKLETSKRTADLRDALTKMTTRSPEEMAAKASAAMSAVGISAMGGAASSARVAATGVGSAPGGEKPDIELSAIEKYRQRIKELDDAIAKKTITQAEYAAGIKQVRRDILNIDDPIQQYRDRVALLDEAMRGGTISSEEYLREIQAAKDGFIDQTPIERYMARVKELKELFDAGIINDSQFKTAQMDAMPDKVKAIIENSKTPLEKFNEQISEARDFFSKGLIDQNQFSAEQERLQKEFREEEKKKLGKRAFGEVAVSFSAASLISQGMGARGGGARDELGGKLDTQISETKTQTEVLKNIFEQVKRKPTFS